MPHPRPLLLFALMLPLSVAACDAPATTGGQSASVGTRSLLPVIDSLEPDPAEPGDEVVLRGFFHKLRADQGLFVSFNGFDSPHVTLVSDREIRAIVPEGATSGNVVVVIGESVGRGRFLKIKEQKGR